MDINYSEWLISFFSLFIVDILYVIYMKSVQQDKILFASLWASLIYMLNSAAIITYTSNNYTLIAAVAGAFLGTYTGMKIK